MLLWARQSCKVAQHLYGLLTSSEPSQGIALSTIGITMHAIHSCQSLPQCAGNSSMNMPGSMLSCVCVLHSINILTFQESGSLLDPMPCNMHIQ